MADDRDNRRPKSASGASGWGTRDGRVPSLKSETKDVGSPQLRQQLQGNRDAMLPLVKQSPAVGLPCLNDDLLTQVSSFVGTSRELLSLALTCRSFGRRKPGSGLDWSLAEEVARQAVCSGKNDVDGVRVSLSQYEVGRTTWLSILHESEHPLKFNTLLGRDIGYRSSSETSVWGAGMPMVNAAVASGYMMISGIHYAEFQIINGSPDIGIVRPMPHLDPDRFDTFNFYTIYLLHNEFLAERTVEWGGNVHACQYSCGDGILCWTNWEADEDAYWEDWEGREDCQSGDTLGMLLNLDEGTLTVYKNNRRLGMMKDGLLGSYCWYVSVWEDSAVAVKRGEVSGHTALFPGV